MKQPTKNDISDRINVGLTKKYGRPYNINWSKLNVDALKLLEKLVEDASGFDESNVPISDHINEMVAELTGDKSNGKWYKLDECDLEFAEGMVMMVRDIKRGKFPDGKSGIDIGSMNFLEAAELYLKSRKEKYKGRIRGVLRDLGF